MDLTRGADPALISALSENPFYPIAIVRIDWPDENGNAVRVHSGTGTLSWKGNTWLGLGDLGSISAPEETETLVPEELRLTLRGTLTELLALSSEDDHRGDDVFMWVGCTTTPGGTTLKGDPELGFYGTIDETPFQESEDGTLAELTVIARSGPPARADAEVVHSDEDQQSKYPGDTLFRRVAHAEKFNSNPPQWPAP